MTRNLRTLSIVFLTALFFTTLAWAQNFLGPVIKLNASDESTFPAADSGYVTGGLLYGTDAGTVYVSNGTQWLPLMYQGDAGSGGSSFSYWLDAGVVSSGGVFPASGTGAAIRTDSYVIDQTNSAQGLWLIQKDTVSGPYPITNPALTLYSSGNYTALKFSNGFQMDNNGSGYVLYSAADSPGNGVGFGLNLRANSIWFDELGTERFGRFDSSTNGFVATTPAGSNAWANFTNGARIDLGSGLDDYAASDGTGIETPSYWESTRALATGPGLVSNAMTLSTASTQSFDSTLSSTYAAGSIATDDLQGTMIRRLSSGTNAFAPIAPHIVYDEQTFTTRIIGKELNAPPKFAEFVPTSNVSSTYLDMYWTDGDNITQVLGTRLWYYIATSDTLNDQQYGISTASTLGTFSGTTFQRMTSSDLSPSICQRVYTGTDVTNTRVWVGLGANTLAAATSTMSQNGIFMRYDPTVDTDWQLCTKDGTTQSCAKTTVAVTASTEYVLCAKLDSARTAYGYINGAFVVRKTSNRVPTDTVLGPFISVENLAGGLGSSRRLYIGVMQIGTR